MVDLPADPRLDPDRLARLESRLAYRFQDRSLLGLALCHSSSRQSGLPSNERLEFLGDSVLGFLIAMHLFDAHARMKVGELTHRRTQAVSRHALFQAAKTLEIEDYLIVGPGLVVDGKLPKNVLADAMEALVAAVFLDRGIEAAWGFVACHFLSFLRHAPGASPLGDNHKARLQALVHGLGHKQSPSYSVVSQQGPPHDRLYRVEVEAAGRRFGPGEARSLRSAEQKAAALALAWFEAEGEKEAQPGHT